MPTSIKIESPVIPKAFMRVFSLRALLDIATDGSGTEKVEIGIIDIVLLFNFIPYQVLSFMHMPLSKI